MRTLVFFLISLTLLSCQTEEKDSPISSRSNSNDNENSDQQIECDYTYPEIGGLLIDIDAWDGMNPGVAGDFIFDSGYTYDQHIYAFGEFISSTKQLGNIEFHPSQSAQVLSPVEGVIETIAENSPLETKGYEIFIKTSSDSCFTIIVDHVRNLEVTEGQTVSIGTLLGNPGHFGASLGQVELQINDEKENRAWCAMAFMDIATRATYNAKIDDFRSDWESLIADSSIYDESKDSNGSGLCHFESLLESEIVNE